MGNLRVGQVSEFSGEKNQTVRVIAMSSEWRPIQSPSR